MEVFKVNEEIALAEFKKLKIKHKYVIDLKQIQDESVIRASSLLNRLSWAKHDFSNFSDKIILSNNIEMKEECKVIFYDIQDKLWKLDDVLSKIKVSVVFD